MKKEENIVTYTLEAAKMLPDGTDWEAVNAMTQEEIELNAQEDTLENLQGFETIGMRIPYEEFDQVISLEKDVAAKMHGGNFRKRKIVNEALRQYFETHPQEIWGIEPNPI